MPSIKTITPILGGSYYHIFNRGANGHRIFYQPKNFDYFLVLLSKFLSGYVHFLAYSLMPNHFHLIVKIKDLLPPEIISGLKGNRSFKKVNDSFALNENEIGNLVVGQLKRLFITYSMAINKQENRIGNLFDPKYKRLEITNQDYLEYAIFYTHFNPEKHGIIPDFRAYRYSSYIALTGTGKTNIDKEFVWDLFGGEIEFKNYHSVIHEERMAIIME